MTEENKETIGFNTKCERFKQKLIDDINSCDIPIAPAYYIFQNLYQEIEKTYYGILNKESVPEEGEPIDLLNMENSEEEEGAESQQ